MYITKYDCRYLLLKYLFIYYYLLLTYFVIASQLYGMKGLITDTPEYKKKIIKREGGWDHNFVAAKSLNQPANPKDLMMHSINSQSQSQSQQGSINGHNKLQLPSRSLSPVTRNGRDNSGGINYGINNNSYDQGSTGTLKGMLPSRSLASVDTSTSTTAIKTRRSRCNKKDITDRDLIIIGQYRFTDEQMVIYNKFTEMLTEFDEFDIKNILEDAWKDSLTNTRLENYGGTTMIENESSYIEESSQLEANHFR